MSQTAIAVEDLVKRYRPGAPPANDGLTLQVQQGEVFGLLGPNGAGKSSLVRQVAGLVRPTSGQIRIFGHDIVKEPHWASQFIAMQPQGQALPVQARLGEILTLTGRLRGLAPQAATAAVDALFEQFNLGAHRAKRLVELSGGLRRLAAIASTLIGNAPILIFDEPTNDLDPVIRRVVWNRIREAAVAGSTILLVTHNVVEAEQALDRVAIIQRGRIHAMGRPAELKVQAGAQVRLQLRVSDPATIAPLLPAHLGPVTAGQLVTWPLAPGELEPTVARLLPQLDRLEEFKVLPPSLEDVYLTLSGGGSVAAD